MSAKCNCPEKRKRKLRDRNWKVISVFYVSGARLVKCNSCGVTWRTKGRYANKLDWSREAFRREGMRLHPERQ